ncbi:MAG: four-helix bundle copper-binding protein [Enhydrobacter sp.]|nr:four-helix bundle copper-binding protein [Enhydrobacter sp.]
MHTHAMIATHPHVHGKVDGSLVRLIDFCFDCAQTCVSCADACLAEVTVADLRQCIRLALDCADICNATGSVASRRTGTNEDVVRRLIDACAEACLLCAEECEKHAGDHEHCRVCAETCRQCERACREAAITIGLAFA